MKSLFFSFALLLASVSFGFAQQNAYLFGYGGYSFGDSLDSNLPMGMGSIEIDTDDGFMFGVGLGFRFPCLNGCRFEIEGVFNEDNIETAILKTPAPAMVPEPIRPTPPPPPPPMDNDGEGEEEFIEDLNPTSEIFVRAAMFNFLKEIPLDCFTAYFGGGIGVASYGIDSGLGTVHFHDSDTVFAWQAIVGIDYPVSPCVSVFGQYRMLATEAAHLNSSGLEFTTDQHKTHSFNLGARYKF